MHRYLIRDRELLSMGDRGIVNYLAFVESIEVEAFPKVLEHETLVIVRQPWDNIVTVNISKILNFITRK